MEEDKKMTVCELRRQGYFEFQGNMCKVDTTDMSAEAIPIYVNEPERYCYLSETCDVDFWAMPLEDHHDFWEMFATFLMGETL